MSVTKPLSSSQSASAIMDSISRSSAAKLWREAAEVGWKLARSTGKAAWIAGTTFLVLGLPLIFAMEQEASINDMIQNEQDEIRTILGTTS
ncbi:hypothetical protein PR202_ga29869 [Eleusine coracana subsp. coracana]|uniref:Uncharacterized protein n=1 Tax=Eleusine coracana subsp. coracana TaxID=191504 RepID=A0AAV5DP42_ELECO|nr:hypothetical protein PR202_ga29869 [Eleusine coracana subsp. coracana]